MITFPPNKSVNLQDVSESLRGPLASLGVCLQTLRDHAGQDAAPFVASALGDVERLSRLARHLLEWSELEGGTLRAHPSAFQVSDRLTDVVEWHMQQARLADIPFRMAIEPGDDRAWTDPDHAAGILDALLEHVLATMEEGGVDVAIDIGSTDCAMNITADHATGLTDTMHLARARALADLLGGHVTLKPSVSAGTVLAAHFPLRLPRQTTLHLAA